MSRAFFLQLTVFVSLIFPVSAVKSAEDQLDQGWNEKTIYEWSTASQGSRLIPESWLLALERSENQTAFLDPKFVSELGYLPGLTSNGVNSTLPFGFAVDQQSDIDLAKTKLRWKANQADNERWVGLNCAACHTRKITYQNKSLIVQGAPSLTNFQVLIEELNRSLEATQNQLGKFDRFSGKVLGVDNNQQNRDMLKAALREHLEWHKRLASTNQTPLRYGFGRLDAVGHILNKVALTLDEASARPSPSDAPVAFPQIWNAPQLDFLQWNGIAQNLPKNKISVVLSGIASQPFDVGALGRNAGEVIGVFADINTKKIGLVGGGRHSSINIRNLIEMEQALSTLRSPKWPELTFGLIDTNKSGRGKGLFEKNCASCHILLSGDSSLPVYAQMSFLTSLNTTTLTKGRQTTKAPANTDPAMACNTFMFQANSGFLNGQKSEQSQSGFISSRDSGAALLSGLVQSTLTYKASEIADYALLSRLGWDGFSVVPPRTKLIRDNLSTTKSFDINKSFATIDGQCLKQSDILIAYKGRPLNGIWATAPYLHNDSVPNLYELLLPPSMRRSTFCTGTTEFDPKNVGLKLECSTDNPFSFNTRKPDGSLMRGNSNTGHDYSNDNLTDTQRYELIEYIKTL